MNVVVFKISDREYGADISQVKEVIRARKITPISGAADFIEGVLLLRGMVIPVINLRVKMGLEKRVIDRKSRFIIARLEDNNIAFIVDEVSDVLFIAQEKISSPDQLLHKAEYLMGLANIDRKLILLTDLAKLLTFEERSGMNRVFDKVKVRHKI